MKRLSWRQIHARRLARSHLIERAPRQHLVEVVGDVCGVHAQLLTAAELSIAARVEGITQRDVRAELWERRHLVKTSGPRGTLHLLPADELPMWMAALRADPYWQDPRWLARFGMTAKEAETILEAIGDALDGGCLLWNELADEIARRVGPWATRATDIIQFGGHAPKWSQLLGVAAYTGRFCYGPSRGNNVTFVRADQWIAGWKELDHTQALREVFRRYLGAYGPATPEHFAHWFHVKPEEVRRLAGPLADELEEVDVEGHRAWMLAADAKTSSVSAAGSLRLLPYYDCYVIGAAPPGYPRESVVPKTAGNRVFSRGAGPFPVVLIDGIARGVWKLTKRGRRIEIRVEPFQPLTGKHLKEVKVEANRIGEFLGAEAALSIGVLR